MTQPSAASGGIIQTEPVAAFLAGLAGLVDLGIIAASALNWVDLTDEQTAAIIAFVSGAIAFAGGMLRAKVWAPASVAAISSPGPVV